MSDLQQQTVHGAIQITDVDVLRFYGLSCYCAAVMEMVTETISTEETTVEAAITAVSGLSSYFSAVVALAVAAAAITAADVLAADLHFYCGSFWPAAFRFSVFLFLPTLSFSLSFSRTLHFTLHSVLFNAFFIYLVYVVTIYDKHISFFNNICCNIA